MQTNLVEQWEPARSHVKFENQTPLESKAKENRGRAKIIEGNPVDGRDPWLFAARFFFESIRSVSIGCNKKERRKKKEGSNQSGRPWEKHLSAIRSPSVLTNFSSFIVPFFSRQTIFSNLLTSFYSVTLPPPHLRVLGFTSLQSIIPPSDWSIVPSFT